MFMHHTYFNDLAAIVMGDIVAQVGNTSITEITLDSRVQTTTPFPLFFALVGINHNGHDYIEAAYANGVRQFVVDIDYDHTCMVQHSAINMIKVPSALAALQAFSAAYRSKYILPVLAITGSTGKTITKEWIHLLLASKHRTVSSPYSYNTQIGVPLSLSSLAPDHTYAVFEAGISMVGEMEKLAKMIHPTHGLLTNIGPAHSEGFENLYQKIKEKAGLFETCTTIYYCRDHTLIHEALQALYGAHKHYVTWSTHDPTATYLVRQDVYPAKTLLRVTCRGSVHLFYTSFQDHASLENLTHCLVYLLDNGFEAESIQSMLPLLPRLPIRLSWKAGVHNCQLIIDNYLNDIGNLKIALDAMQQQTKQKKTLILTDMIQTFIPDLERYRSISTLISGYPIHRLIGIGPKMYQYADLFSMPESAFFTTTEDFIRHRPSFREETILVKGGNEFELARLIESIEENSHGTVLEIDMHAIRHNLSYFRTRLKPDTRIMAMVKASAYGSGSSNFELASALQRHGVAKLGVAYTQEGIKLRKQGITLPIMVMHPTNDAFKSIIDYQLEPEIYSLELLNELQDFIRERSIRHIKIHLKLETGMYRLGIAQEELSCLVAYLKQMPEIEITTIFSHLAAAQAATYDAYTLQQGERFIEMVAYLENQLKITPIKHLLNSNGILRFPQFEFDMVRLGIGLHGVGVDKATQRHLIPASKLKTTISQIKHRAKGERVGYDLKFLAERDSTIAVIPIGYADGLSRAFGCNKGHVLIQGKACPIIGQVCMDMAMVDVTDISVKRGDEVIIFSAEHAVDALAKQVGTISYELLTQISQRVKRVYYT